MRIKINDFFNKPVWVIKLSAFLHDGNMEREYDWDPQKKNFTWRIDRIYYETPHLGRFLFFFKSWNYQEIPSIISLKDVIDVLDERQVSTDIGEPESFYAWEILKKKYIET